MNKSEGFLGVFIGLVLTFAVTATGATFEFFPTGSMATARAYHTATLLPNGKVLVADGNAELFDPSSGTWAFPGSMATGRWFHTATLLPNGKVLVAGGENGNSLASAELFGPSSGIWGPTGSMATGRRFHTATLLPNGKVLVAGGYNNGDLNSAELYDPVTGIWSPTGSMATGRSDHTTTLLPNGKVFVAGGHSDGKILANAELYDPTSGTWGPTGSMANARYRYTATLLPNGKVLVSGGVNTAGGVGGLNANYLASAELYDPVTGTWGATGSLATGRYYHTATLLPNGKVLVAGGNFGGGRGGTYLASAELYDPVTGTWSPLGSMANARFGHTATLLPNGKVLVAGGYNGTYHASAELFGSPPVVPAELPPSIHIKGKKKVTISKATCLVKGEASANAVAVQVAVGKGRAAKFRNAKGVSPVWKIKVRLKPRKNLVSARAVTADGRFSQVVKITITRQ